MEAFKDWKRELSVMKDYIVKVRMQGQAGYELEFGEVCDLYNLYLN